MGPPTKNPAGRPVGYVRIPLAKWLPGTYYKRPFAHVRVGVVVTRARHGRKVVRLAGQGEAGLMQIGPPHEFTLLH